MAAGIDHRGYVCVVFSDVSRLPCFPAAALVNPL